MNTGLSVEELLTIVLLAPTYIRDAFAYEWNVCQSSDARLFKKLNCR